MKNDPSSDFISEVRNELDKLSSKGSSEAHKVILAKLLQTIERVDFHEKIGTADENAKLQRKHFLICCIEHVLEVAHQHEWGLCKNNEFIYLFNGNFWNALEPEVLRKFLGEASERMGVDVYEAKYYSFREQLYKQFLSLAHLSTPERTGLCACQFKEWHF